MPDLTHLPIIQQTLLDWYAREGRDLPWRHVRDPYAILVSELMLQQTQVDRVIPKWEAWLEEFPTVEALAEAPTSAVIKAWSGLGYNRRAINLQRLAQAVVAVHGGRVPEDVAELKALPGIGPYTAGAVAAFAHNRPVAMVDVNIRRLLHRLFVGAEVPEYRIAEAAIWALARAAVPPGRSADWHQALMDLGATICRPRPLCDRCPVRDMVPRRAGMGDPPARRTPPDEIAGHVGGLQPPVSGAHPPRSWRAPARRGPAAAASRRAGARWIHRGGRGSGSSPSSARWRVTALSCSSEENDAFMVRLP